MVNPYDPCVANKMVDGAQMNVCWHVDDLNISHRDEDMVTDFTVKMANIYRAKTTISRGRVHDYLGMGMYFGTCPGALITSGTSFSAPDNLWELVYYFLCYLIMYMISAPGHVPKYIPIPR